MLKALCLDSRRSTILQKLELSLDILGGTVERISNTAEVLGAVHQEARVSRAVDLMVAHVENLRRKYERNLSELEEARRQVQLRTAHRHARNRESPESEENRDSHRLTKQGSLRRRISASIITNQTNEKKKKERKRGGKKSSSSYPSPTPSSESSICVLDSSFTDDRTPDPTETAEAHSESDIITPPVEPPPVLVVKPPSDPKPEDLLPKPESAANVSNKNSTSETLRQRHRWRAALARKKSDRKNTLLNQRTPAARCGSQCKGTHWMYRCRWALLCLYLSVFVCFIIIFYYLLLQYEDSESY
ncbi:hypothetical protein NL108_001544 [Boleophthalmus pectinirostris]|nr:hypothetical protein NL108_001544 [Boleophthalmus pectinirostris]